MSSSFLSYLQLIDKTNYETMKNSAGGGFGIGIVKASGSYEDFKTRIDKLFQLTDFKKTYQQARSYVRAYVPDTAINAWLGCINSPEVHVFARNVGARDFTLRVFWNPPNGQGATRIRIDLTGCTFTEGSATRKDLQFNGRTDAGYTVKRSTDTCRVVANTEPGAYTDDFVLEPEVTPRSVRFYLAVTGAQEPRSGPASVKLSLFANADSYDPKTTNDATNSVMHSLLSGDGIVDINSRAEGPGWWLDYRLFSRVLRESSPPIDTTVCQGRLGYDAGARSRRCDVLAQ